MKTELLDGLLDRAEQHARTLIFEEHESVKPTWIMVDSKDLHKITTPWRDEYEKDIARVYLLIEIKLRGIIAYSFVSEVWVANDKTLKGPPPRERPDRREMVFALATDGQEIKHRAWNIIRDWEERIVKLEQEDLGGMEGWGGWIGSLLSEPEK